MLGLSDNLTKTVFVYLCICVYLCIWICVFGCRTLGNIVFEVLVQFPLGLDWVGMGWDLCAGLLYEHRFAVLIKKNAIPSL